MGRNHRARWSAIGAAVAVSIGAGGLITFASASGGTASVFTPITPCRLLDTRADGPAVGATPPRATPLGQGETLTIPARGSFGLCNSLSAAATGAVLNVTVVNPTAGSYLTVWPADKPKPLASSLNWTAGQSATPNQVTTALDPSGHAQPVQQLRHGRRDRRCRRPVRTCLDRRRRRCDRTCWSCRPGRSRRSQGRQGRCRNPRSGGVKARQARREAQRVPPDLKVNRGPS